MKSRRTFLKNSSLLSLGLFLPINLTFLPLFSGKSSISAHSLEELLSEAANYRKNRSFNNARNIYYDIIGDFPEEIRAYDGLRKTILIDPNGKYEELLDNFMKANKAFPNNPHFKERLAKEYMNVALGNRVYVKKIFKRDTLLEEALKIFDSLRLSFPNVQQYQEQYEKAGRKIEQHADSLDARQNEKIKKFKKEQKELYRVRFDNVSISILKDKIKDATQLKQNRNRDKHIKELIMIVVRRYESAGQYSNALSFIRDSLSLYPNDSNFLHIAKRIAKERNNYNVLINVCNNFPSTNRNFWNKLSSLDAYLFRLENTGVGNLNSINSKLQNLIPQADDARKQLELNYRAVKFNVIANRLNDAKNALITFGNFFNGSENAHVFILYCQALKMYHNKAGTSYQAYKFINYALGNDDLNFTNTDELTEINKEILLSVTIDKPFHIARLNQLLTT